MGPESGFRVGSRVRVNRGSRVGCILGSILGSVLGPYWGLEVASLGRVEVIHDVMQRALHHSTHTHTDHTTAQYPVRYEACRRYGGDCHIRKVQSIYDCLPVATVGERR